MKKQVVFIFMIMSSQFFCWFLVWWKKQKSRKLFSKNFRPYINLHHNLQNLLEFYLIPIRNKYYKNMKKILIYKVIMIITFISY